MIRSLALAVLLLPSLSFACADQTGSPELIAQVEAKFGLKARTVAYKCGGAAVSFMYVPPEPLVPANSYFARWNDEFSLGDVPGDDGLRAMLALSKAEMDALIMANVHFMQDSYAAQNRYGVRAYHPNALPAASRLSDRGMLMWVTAPHCTGTRSTNARQIGELYLGVHELEGATLLGRVPLYKKGDLLRAVAAEPTVLSRLRQVARDNAAAIADGERSAVWCAEGMERGTRIDWNAVLQLLASSARPLLLQ